MAPSFETPHARNEQFCASPLAASAAILELGLADFLNEVRLIEANDLITYVRHGQFPNISDLISSSAELSLQPGKLLFSWSANLEMCWERRPIVVLDMEFSHAGVTAFFRLRLSERHANLESRSITIENDQNGEEDCLMRLSRALADARISSFPKNNR